MGDHAALMARHGLYERLYSLSSVIDVQCIVDSYLSFAREKRALSPWQVLSPLGLH